MADTARGAKNDSLTGERHDPIIATGCAADTNDTVAEQATCEELAELAQGDARHAALPCRSLCPYSVETQSAASAPLLRCGARGKAEPEDDQLKNTGSGSP